MALVTTELIRSALRVLSAFSKGISPNPQDVQAIKAAVPSTQPELPPNVIAAYIVDRAEHAAERATPPNELAADMQAQTQHALVQVLNADLDLAFTLVNTAQIGRAPDPDGSLAALTRAGMALQQVRRFAGRIRDPIDVTRIQARAAELEAALGEIKRSRSS